MADRPTKHRTVAVDVDAVPDSPKREISWPWHAVAVVGTAAVLAAGWLLMAGSAALGWLTSPESELSQALLLGSDILLLAHGVPAEIGGQTVSIMPLGLSLILILLAQQVAAFSARQAAQTQVPGDDTERIWLDKRDMVLRVAGTMAATQGVGVAALAILWGSPGGALRGLLGGLVLGGIAGLWGASRAVSFDPRRDWPMWLRSVPTALAAALLVCILGGATALGAALIIHRDRIMSIQGALEPGVSGTILLFVAQLLYLPNMVLWATSWVLGAGVTLGDDSLLSISVVDVGFLPAIPVFGAVGEPGIGGGNLFWWLAVGVVAGLVAAAVVVLARPRARFDETALVGGLSGVSAGALITVLCSLASGGLGSGRLAHVGAITGQLIIVAPALVGLSGLLAGAILGLVRRPDPASSSMQEDGLEVAEP